MIYSNNKFNINNNFNNNNNININNNINVNNNINQNAIYNSNINSINNSQLEALTSSDGAGGYIKISTGSLFISKGSKLDSSTSGKGNAGNINIHADTLTIETQGSITSSAQTQAQGNAGDIVINSPNINLSDKATIVVDSSSPENTSSAGTITLNTNFLKIDNVSINAKNASGNGGNIEITTQDLILRNNSEISTSAGSPNTPGNGGKININAENGYVIAVPTENSDIIANAFGGNGGKINISAIRVLGFESRGKLNTEQLQAIRTNGTSDISASSDVGTQGNVVIQTLGIDPSQGLVAVPIDLVDPSGLIAQGCNSSNNNVAQGQSEFVITGRGGIPPSPDDVLTTEGLPAKWVTREKGDREISYQRIIPAIAITPLVEAQGMVRNENGDIVLVAQPVNSTGFQSELSRKLCGLAQKL